MFSVGGMNMHVRRVGLQRSRTKTGGMDSELARKKRLK